MSFESLTGTTGPTPGRSTTLTLDVTERILAERGLNDTRRGAEVAKADAQGNAPNSPTYGMKYWSSGAWTLAPIQQDLTTVHEESAGQAAILKRADFNLYQLKVNGTAQSIVTTRNNWAQSALTGAGYSANIATTGDPFLYPAWPAGVNLDPSQVPANNALTSTIPLVTLPNLEVPNDRIGVSTATFRADQGYFLRWFAPGTASNYPRYTWTFYFGQYALAFTGDGKSLLYEYCRDNAAAYRWVKRAAWRYANSKQVLGTTHSMMIWPHIAPNGQRYIAFTNNQLEQSQQVDKGEKTDARGNAAHEYVYRVSPVFRSSDMDESPGHATKSNPCAWDNRRELAVQVQISKLMWATAGKLVDFPHSIGTAVANTNAVTVTMASVKPNGSTLTTLTNDFDTGNAFRPGLDTKPYPVFNFGGDGTDTAILYGYRIRQPEVVQSISPGSFPVDIESVSVNSFSGEPSEESAYADAYDLGMTHTRLTKRARFSAKITVQDPIAGTVTLFRGYVVRPRSQQVGTGRVGGFNASSTPLTYPAASWRRYQLSMMGMWMRLAERVTPSFGQFGFDATAAPDPVTGQVPPWKVTDAIRFLLLSCGFDSAQVDIPDLSFRMWPGHAQTITDGVIEPGTDIAEVIVRMCRNYLGCYLWYNQNSGSDGKWQLLFASQANPDGTYNPLYNFVSLAPDGKNSVMAGSYPAATTFIDGSPNYVTIPPDYNAIIVTTGQALTDNATKIKHVGYAYNYLSFNVPGATVAANPEHPDYIGYMLPFEIVDASLNCDNDPVATQKAIAWTTRRAYDFYCHSQSIVTFRAPLVFILDASLNVYRPLRFQDPVSIDGNPNYLVKSMTINYSKDHVQMATYECINPQPGQYFWGVDGLHFKRHADKNAARKANGHKTTSNHWGLLTPSPAEEQRALSLPLYAPLQVPLQGTNGAFIPINGYNTATGAAG